MRNDKELKKVIIEWLFVHENEWNRTNACIDEFRAYIYNEHGDYLIGGENVANFIKEAEKLIFN